MITEYLLSKINYLSEDKAFGILTRQALELKISESEVNMRVYVIDFNGIHDLNKKLGYLKVNGIIHELFRQLKLKYPYQAVFFGRIFSGDEVAIVVNHTYPNKVINDFIKICKNKDIGFKFVNHCLTSKTPVDRVSAVLDAMSTQLQIEPIYSHVYDN